MRHDPLRRSGDRLEAVLAVALVVLAAVMLPLAIWLGNLTGDRQGALAAQQASEYRQVTATTVGDATSQSIAGDTIPTSVDTAPARWVVAGVEHRADVNVEPETLAGTEVSIWVDGDGNVASEPISASAAATAGVMVGLFTWMSTMILATTAFLGSRALLNRRRSRQWSREISEFLGSATSH
ncbi:hypothetical protein ACFYVR_14600 [Rhodococcus sp. NPDC003318]|uniref:Rv1733c family protein n=1 Tax=Rhodococcus sp. NPDC003318 TaxID=3364503 RepID=UPI0036BD95E9